MDFVTKKDFEAAMSVIQKALKANQLVITTTGETFQTLLVGFEGHAEWAAPITHATFVAPDLAAKNRLHNLRNELKAKKEDNNKVQDSLVKLETELQKLLSVIPTLKE